MMNAKLISLLIAILSISACSSNIKVKDLSADEQSAYQKIMKADVSDENYTVIGDIEGGCCFRGITDLLKGKLTKGSSASTAKAQKIEALHELRLKAVRMGADAIINEECSIAGVDWKKHCWSSTTCKGTAVKLNKE